MNINYFRMKILETAQKAKEITEGRAPLRPVYPKGTYEHREHSSGSPKYLLLLVREGHARFVRATFRIRGKKVRHRLQYATR